MEANSQRQAIREEIAQVVPFYYGIQRLQKTGDAFQYGGPHLCAGNKFATADRKAHFRAVPLPNLDRAPGAFEVSTRRGKQFNSLIYAEVDPLTGAARDSVFMNPEDAAALHLRNRDRVVLRNDLGTMEARVFFAPLRAAICRSTGPKPTASFAAAWWTQSAACPITTRR